MQQRHDFFWFKLLNPSSPTSDDNEIAIYIITTYANKSFK